MRLLRWLWTSRIPWTALGFLNLAAMPFDLHAVAIGHHPVYHACMFAMRALIVAWFLILEPFLFTPLIEVLEP